jgi:ATP-dependent 26S proteasome regulatory subunit
MLGQRTRVGEHEAMRKIKNEFMTHWDGLLTKPGERILVLAATNRPFDLDEAIIRRFERRYVLFLLIPLIGLLTNIISIIRHSWSMITSNSLKFVIIFSVHSS